MASSSPPPSSNLWVGGLPPTLDQEGLQALFAPYGTVESCRVLPPKQEGMTSSAMIRFANVEEATWLVTNLNGNMLEGLESPIIVKFANPPKKTTWNNMNLSPQAQLLQQNTANRSNLVDASAASSMGMDIAPPSDNLYIGGLPPTLDKEGLQALFKNYGTVVDCRVLPAQKEGGISAMIRFGSVDEADWLVKCLNGNIPEGLDSPITVKFANRPRSVVAAMSTNWNQGPYAQVSGANWNAGREAGKGLVQSAGKGATGKLAAGRGPAPGTFQALYQAVTDKFGAMPAPIENQVYVNSLPADTTDLDLYRLFSPFGAVAPNGVKAMVAPDGTCKGFGFVDFVESSSATLAVTQLDNFQWNGTTLHCSIKAPPTRARGKGGTATGSDMLALDGCNGGDL